jgi:catechol 2,3-dioxygenase-like lactoylglutathione lyase family enzyme
VFAHIGFEVSDLARSARFYDAIFFPLGCRRQYEAPSAVAYGRLDARFWIVARGREPAPGYGHVALEAVGRAAAGGSDDGAPGPRPQYGPRYFAAYLRDPDGLRVELVSGQE